MINNPLFPLIKKLLKAIFKKSGRTTIPESAIIPRQSHPISQSDVSHHALNVVKHLTNHHYQAYLVGGSVRDLLLKQKPKDFDVATSATPNQVKKLFKNARLIGRRFKLAHIYFRRELIEVATFRGKEEKSSKAQETNQDGMVIRDNVFGTLESDVWRRDLSINALYYCPKQHAIIDYVGGVKDIEDKTIRIIGKPDERFTEDPVRMIRAIRFAAKLDFFIEAETAKSMLKNAHLIQGVSNARLFEEVIKVFHSGHGQKAQKLLVEYKLFEYLFPQTTKANQENSHCFALIDKTLKNTDRRIQATKPVTPAFIFAVLLWHPMLQAAKNIQQNHKGMSRLESLEKATLSVFQQQNKISHVPKRFSQYIKEMWLLQYRFDKREGNRCFSLLNHPRFRAAYDLYALRAEVNESNKATLNWWTRFQVAKNQEQVAMIAQLNPQPKNNNTATDAPKSENE